MGEVHLPWALKIDLGQALRRTVGHVTGHPSPLIAREAETCTSAFRRGLAIFTVFPIFWVGGFATLFDIAILSSFSTK